MGSFSGQGTAAVGLPAGGAQEQGAGILQGQAVRGLCSQEGAASENSKLWTPPSALGRDVADNNVSGSGLGGLGGGAVPWQGVLGRGGGFWKAGTQGPSKLCVCLPGLT